MKYLGLDLGSRTLGIATSDATGLIASTYKTIRHNEEYDRLLDEVKQLIEELKIDEVVKFIEQRGIKVIRVFEQIDNGVVFDIVKNSSTGQAICFISNILYKSPI